MKELTVSFFCGSGISASLIASRFKPLASGNNLPCKVLSGSISGQKDLVPESDVVVLCPPVHYARGSIVKEYPEKLVICAHGGILEEADLHALINMVRNYGQDR